MINSLSQPTLSVLSFTLSNWTAKNISGNAVTLGSATLLFSSRSYAPLKTAPTRQAVRNITWYANHGFARDSEFTYAGSTKNSVSFVLKTMT